MVLWGLDGSTGEKWSGSRYILKTELTGLIHTLDGKWGRKALRAVLKVLAWATGWMQGVRVVDEQVWNMWVHAGKWEFSLGHFFGTVWDYSRHWWSWLYQSGVWEKDRTSSPIISWDNTSWMKICNCLTCGCHVTFWGWCLFVSSPLYSTPFQPLYLWLETLLL